MIIEYKKPYWIKYKWEMDKFDNNEFVTPFNKTDSSEVTNFIYKDKFSIICDFSIKHEFNKDVKAGVFGKAGQNFGLNFDYSIDSLVFEFRTINDEREIKFHCIIMDKINSDMVDNGVVISVIKNNNTFMFYCDSDIITTYEYNGDPFIEEYKDSPLYVGCLNPGAADKKDRCHSDIEIRHLSIIQNNDSIDFAKSLIDTEYHDMPIKKHYDDILCIYDFKLLNNYKNVFDNSKYSHFLELVPKEFVL